MRPSTLTLAENGRWGASNANSTAITAASVAALGIGGTHWRPATHDVAATRIARAYLDAIRAAPATAPRLYSGHETLPTLAAGDTALFPLFATSPDKDMARQFALGDAPTLLVIAPGARALLYTIDEEWIIAGLFRVERVHRSVDPYGGTPLRLVTLRAVPPQLPPTLSRMVTS